MGIMGQIVLNNLFKYNYYNKVLYEKFLEKLKNL